MSHKMKTFLGALLFIVVLAFTLEAALAESEDVIETVITSAQPNTVVVKEEEPVFNATKADREVVKITDLKGEFRATGFYVGNDTVVTAYHVTVDKHQVHTPFGVVDGKTELFEHLLIRDKSGGVALGVVTYRDEKNDVAFITLSNNDLYVNAATLVVALPNRGDTLYVIGHPYGFTWSLSKGYLMHSTMEVKGDTRSLASMAGTYGMSGSPVYNERGEVVGVASAIFSVGDGLVFIPVALWKDKLDAK